MKRIDIGTDFSLDPSGRFYTDGMGKSGEEFREKHLMPAINALDENEKIVFILDNGVESYGSSFLTEAFAGPVKYGYIKADSLLSKIQFEYSDSEFSFFEDKIKKYIKEAKFNSRIYKSTLQ